MGAGPRLTAPEADVAPEVRRAALVLTVTSAFALPLMLASVTVALPGIARDLHLDAITLSWVPLVFLLGSGSTLLTFGRLSDMLGRKRVFQWGAWALIASSVLLACAPNGTWLLVFRIFQGVSAAMLYSTQAAIITSVYPPRQRGQAIGLIASSVYFGLTAGPLLGGWLVGQFGWRAAFVIHVPLTLVVLLLALPRVQGEWKGEPGGGFDWLGAVTWAVGIIGLIGGASVPASAGSVVAMAGGALMLTIFVLVQRQRTTPLFDVRLFATNRVFGLSALASWLMYTTTFSILVLISLHLQYLKGLSPRQAGLVMFAQPLVTALLAPFVGRWSDRVEPRLLATAGVVLTGCGLLLLAGVGRATPVSVITGCLALIGLGFSLFAPTNANAMMSAIDRAQHGSASSMVATMRVLGQVSSMGLVAMAFGLTLGSREIGESTLPALERALSLSFTLAAVLCVPGAFCSMARGRLREH